LADIDIKLVVDMRGIDLSQLHFFIRQFVVAAQAELNHTQKQSLFLKGQIAVLEDFTFAEWDAHKSGLFRAVEEVVADVLELQVR